MIEIYTETSEKLQIPTKVVEYVVNHYCRTARSKFATLDFIRIKIPYIVVFKLKRLKLMVYIRTLIHDRDTKSADNNDKIRMLLSVYKQLLTANYKISRKWFKFNRKMTKQNRAKGSQITNQKLEV